MLHNREKGEKGKGHSAYAEWPSKEITYQESFGFFACFHRKICFETLPVKL